MNIFRFIESANRVLDIWEFCTKYQIRTMSEMFCIQMNTGWSRDDVAILVSDVKIIGSKYYSIFKELSDIKDSLIGKKIEDEIFQIQMRANDVGFYDKSLLVYFFPYDDNDAELNGINNDLAELFLYLHQGLIRLNEMFSELADDEEFDEFTKKDDSLLLNLFKGNRRILNIFLKRIESMNKGTDIANEIIALQQLGKARNDISKDLLREELSKIKDGIPKKSAFNSAFVVDSTKRKHSIEQAKDAYR